MFLERLHGAAIGRSHDDKADREEFRTTACKDCLCVDPVGVVESTISFRGDLCIDSMSTVGWGSGSKRPRYQEPADPMQTLDYMWY